MATLERNGSRRGSQRKTFMGGVVEAGQSADSYHASGFPIYQNLPDKLTEQQLAEYGDGEESDYAEIPEIYRDVEGLRMPSSFMYTKEGVYDNLPAQKENSDMEYSKEGIYEDAPMRGEAGYAEAGSNLNSNAARNAFAEPVVHDSVLRKAFVHGKIVEDPDRGQRCERCATCPGFEAHYWRKVCKWCRCRRSDHTSDIGARQVDLDRMVSTGSESMAMIKKKYAWVPNGLSPKEVEDYFGALPRECVPLIGSEGEEWRRKQTNLQIPEYDTDWNLCDQLTESELAAFQKFDKIRLREAFDIGDVIKCPDFTKPGHCSECYLKENGTHWPYCSKYIALEPQLELTQSTRSITSRDSSKSMLTAPEDMPDIKMMRKNRKPKSVQVVKKSTGSTLSGARCRHCSEPLRVGEVVVRVDRFEDTGPEDCLFHPSCLVCSQCGELLVDLRCFVDYGWEERGQPGAEMRLFCGRHWADNRRPRCAACDETIHQAQHVFELGRPWHFRHFSCYICDANLVIQDTYVPRESKPLCVDCFETHIADKCAYCKESINPSRGGGGKITVGKKNWHPGCFKCHKCETPLQGKPCVPKGNNVFCKKCYKKMVRSK